MSHRIDYNDVAPSGVKALGGVYGYIAQSSLSSVLVDLVYLRVSQINNCACCLNMHTRDLLNRMAISLRNTPMAIRGNSANTRRNS